MLSVVYPRSLMILFKRIAKYYLVFSLILLGWQCYDFDFFKIITLGQNIFGGLHFDSSEHGAWTVIEILTLSAFYASFVSYFKNIFSAVYIYFIERKHIEYIPFFKKVWFCLTFPIFDIIGKFSLLIALFKKVEWNAIPHTSSVKIEDIRKGAPLKDNYTTKT